MNKPTIEPGDLKMTREALCVAQSAILARARSGRDADRAPHWVRRLQDLIDQIDVARPLGPDGKHGDLHTDLCGCEDQA